MSNGTPSRQDQAPFAPVGQGPHGQPFGPMQGQQGTPPGPRSLAEQQVIYLQQALQSAHTEIHDMRGVMREMKGMKGMLEEMQQRMQLMQMQQQVPSPLGAVSPTGSIEAVVQQLQQMVHGQQTLLTQLLTHKTHQGGVERLPPGVKLQGLATYRGDRDDDLRTWLSQANSYFRLQGMTESTLRVELAGQFLGGNAALWFMAVRRAEAPNRVTTWEELCEQIVTEFVPSDTAQEAREKFSDLTSKNGQKGSLFDYTSQFRTYFNIMKSHGSTHSDADLQFHYLQGLRSDDIRSKMMVEKPKTLEDLISMSHALDAAFHKGQQNKSNRYQGGQGGHQHNASSEQGTSSEQSSEVSVADMDLCAMDTRYNGPNYNSEEKEEIHRRIHDGLCLNCGESGHKAGGRDVPPCKNPPVGSAAIKFVEWRKRKAGKYRR